jgi:hypothetical protein
MFALPASIAAKQVTTPGEPVKVLDIAAGHGLFGIHVALHNPSAEITFQDWENVLEVARENASKMGIAGRVRTIPGSAFEVDLGAGYGGPHVHRVGRAGVERLLHGARCVQIGERPVDRQPATVDRDTGDAIIRGRKRAARAVAKIAERTSAKSQAERDPPSEHIGHSPAHQAGPAGTPIAVAIVVKTVLVIGVVECPVSAAGLESVVRVGAADETRIDLIEADWGSTER